jgi:hypothetical protein
MKRTSLKHLNTLAAVVKLEFHDMFKSDSVMRSRRDDYFTYSLNDTIWDTTSGWRDNYYYNGCDDAAESMFGTDVRFAAMEKDYDLSYIDQASDNYDEDIADQFKRDLADAYCDATCDADESKFYEYVLRDVERFILAVDAPYYTLLAFTPECGKRGEEGYRPPQEKEVEHIHEATSVRFGFTRDWHKGYIAELNDLNAKLPTTHYLCGVSYVCNPDCLQSDAENYVEEDIKKIDTDYNINECASTQDVLDRFFDCSEALYMIKNKSTFDTDHWAWVARTTTRMTTGAAQ